MSLEKLLQDQGPMYFAEGKKVPCGGCGKKIDRGDAEDPNTYCGKCADLHLHGKEDQMPLHPDYKGK